MADDIILVERDGPVALVTLNRPDALNALSRALRTEIVRVFTELKDDPDIRAVVLTGAGRAFTAGVDLKEAGQTGFALGADEDSKAINILAAIEAYPWPVIVPGWGLSQKLSRLIGISRAKELSFTGNFIDAEMSERWGLVNRVYKADELVPAAMKLAHEMCGTQPVMLKKYKALIDDGYGMPFADAMKEEVRRSIEHAESVTADSVEEARKQVTARGRDQQG